MSRKLTISDQKICAGGVPAALSGLKHSIQKMGCTRSYHLLTHANQKDGFDCPGCAWPDSEPRKQIEFCENGAKAIADEAMTRQLAPPFFREHRVSELRKMSDHWLNLQGRLSHPLRWNSLTDHYEPIRWEDAFLLISDEIQRLRDPDESVFYTSGRTSNEAAFLYQLFARLLGTNNLPDCANLCHEPSGLGLKESIGIGKGTVTLDDFNHAEVILVIGQNPGTNHPRMLEALQRSVRRGAKILNINPILEAGTQAFKHPQEISKLLGHGTPLTSLFLPVKINGDVALLKGLMKGILSEEEINPGKILDHPFISDHTQGFESFAESLRSLSWNEIVHGSGIEKEQILAAAKMLAYSKRTICCWAMGITQHENGIANVQMIVNLLLLGGHFGRKGAGVCPVRGHSNVQGDRTMGIWNAPDSQFLDRLERTFGFSMPREPGLSVVDALTAMKKGEIKLFCGLGGNIVSASPDPNESGQALQSCELTVHISTKLNRSHLHPGKRSLILPCLGRTEIDTQAAGVQFVTVENSMGVVSRSQGTLPPLSSNLKSEVAIICSIAKHSLPSEKRDALPWEQLSGNYDKIRDLIEKTIPGFKNLNTRLYECGSLTLPHPIRDERKFPTSSGLAQFIDHELPALSLPPSQFRLMTIRSHDQYNTTVYGLDDRYRGIHAGRNVVFMNPDDMKIHGLTKGDPVNVTSCYHGVERTITHFQIAPYNIPRQCLAAYFPEANALIPIETASKSRTPAFKSVIVTIRPS